jgi:hypothetical protein
MIGGDDGEPAGRIGDPSQGADLGRGEIVPAILC